MRLLACLALAPLIAAAAEPPRVFPIPREMHVAGAPFAVTEEVLIVAADRRLGRLLSAEFADRYGLAVKVGTLIPQGRRAIVLGASAADPLVRSLAARRGVAVPAQAEGYALDVRPDLVLIAGSDAAGAFYGFQSLRQLIRREADAVAIAGAQIRDWPYKPFRGIKLYLPGRDNIPYFKRFVREFMAANKYNKLIVELNAAMRFDRHPELNAGWLDFARDLHATRRERPPGPHGNANSTHHDTADGGILEKEEVAEIVRLAAENHIEVIPEIPSMSHSYYLLTRHPELAEVPEQWPDTFCPSLPASYALLFDVLDEYIEVMKPRMIHIGKDEWRMPWGVCPRCRNRDYRDVFIEDIRKTYDHLRARGVKVAIWGDHLIEPLRGAGLQRARSRSGWEYVRPGALTPAQVRQSIPKDILIFNWFWDESRAATGQGEEDDLMLEEWGFQQVYGNMTPAVQNYSRRSARKSVIGGAPSSWAATTEFNFGKDLMGSFLGCANMLWGTEPAGDVQPLVERYRRRLNETVLPSELDPATPLQIPAVTVAVGEGNRESAAIPIGEDPSSIIFVHALAKPAGNHASYRYIYNFEDSADLLGWYEVFYEDGFVETIPLRYQVNILESNAATYCYRADRAGAAYAFEWRNPRLGKKIVQVRLKGTEGFRQGAGFERSGSVIPPNTILLSGISIVKKRPAPAPRMPR